jgi:serine/threonine protein kinase
MHSKGILHRSVISFLLLSGDIYSPIRRDIQLGNAVIGLPPNEKTIYMIDFGFSKRYIDPHTSRHIQDNRKPRDFIGNYWFSSVNVHCKGRIPTRRDDLEAAALMFIHMMTPGGLPWTRNGVPKEDDEHERLKKAKKDARPEDLCRGLPSEFEEFLRYCRRLRFADCPDYDHWKEEFRALLDENGWGESDDFIWPPPPAYTTAVWLLTLERWTAALISNSAAAILPIIDTAYAEDDHTAGRRECGKGTSRPRRSQARCPSRPRRPHPGRQYPTCQDPVRPERQQTVEAPAPECKEAHTLTEGFTRGHRSRERRDRCAASQGQGTHRRCTHAESRPAPGHR